MSNSHHLVCPHCQAVNRIPSQRMGENPKCGKCQKPLFTGKPLELTESAFKKHISRNDIPVLVDFWAPWCGPCKMMAPAFADAAAKLEPHVRLVKVNTENEQSLGAQLNIRSIPTLALFKNGKEISRQPGAMGPADIVNWTRSKL